ncbi:hypothetical protein B0H11DRAFT_1942624 [Mycena galericulata]|nr:hypothetical protein B0H11DRAFT_1942624 [Mycena galericulata]
MPQPLEITIHREESRDQRATPLASHLLFSVRNPTTTSPIFSRFHWPWPLFHLRASRRPQAAARGAPTAAPVRKENIESKSWVCTSGGTSKIWEGEAKLGGHTVGVAGSRRKSPCVREAMLRSVRDTARGDPSVHGASKASSKQKYGERGVHGGSLSVLDVVNREGALGTEGARRGEDFRRQDGSRIAAGSQRDRIWGRVWWPDYPAVYL